MTTKKPRKKQQHNQRAYEVFVAFFIPFRAFLSTPLASPDLRPAADAAAACDDGDAVAACSGVVSLSNRTLKLWSVQNIPVLCNSVLILESDVLWIRDFDVIVPTLPDSDGLCTTTKFKYNIATVASGAWESDIYSTAYHSFVEYFTGLPKMHENTLTAINHWQVMQRDVLEALRKSLLARTHHNIEDAMLQYGGQDQYDMTEYDAYFSFISYFYPDRVETISLPYVIRQPTFCNYFDVPMLSAFLDSDVAYFTCHDRYNREDFYINCNGRNCKVL
jgi:hypothetical protein